MCEKNPLFCLVFQDRIQQVQQYIKWHAIVSPTWLKWSSKGAKYHANANMKLQNISYYTERLLRIVPRIWTYFDKKAKNMQFDTCLYQSSW